MKKRFLSILLTLSLLLTFLPTLPLTAYAVGNYGVNLDSDAYYSYTNPFYSVVLRTGQEQCTWYCWGRAYELFGIDLPYRGNANTWNYSSGSLIYDSTPAAHSIAVWTSGDPGHVAYVEAIEGDIIYLTEANLDNCDYTEGYQNTTTGYYVNTSGNLSFDTWKNRSTPDGYIHLPIIDSGTCGNSVSWALTSDGVFSVFGSGAMNDYEAYNEMPWYDHLDAIDKVIISNGITHTGDGAFDGCTNLKEIKLSNTIETMGSSFIRCYGLESVTIPYGVKELRGTFARCFNLKEVTLPDSLLNIGDTTFNNCRSLKTITIPDGVTEFGSATFSGSAIESIMIPNNVTEIGDDCFSWCTNLSHISLPNNITHIKYHTFGYCSNLSSVVIPNSVTYIDRDAFRYCIGLKRITIPDGIPSIGGGTFEGCSDLISVNLPSSITKVEGSAFNYCDSLIEVFYRGSRLEWEATAIGEYNAPLADAVIHYNYFVSDDIDTNDENVSEGISVTDAFSKAKENNRAVTINSDSSVIVFDSNAVNQISGQNVVFKMDYAQGDVDDAELVMNIHLDGATFEKGFAKVTTVFEKTAPDGKTAKLYYIDNAGHMTDMHADFEDNKVSFVTSHFSTFAVIFVDELCPQGHTPDVKVIENEVAPTCEIDGKYDEVVYCSICHTELSREISIVPAIGHDWDEGTVTTPATCTMDGVRTYTCKHDASHTYTEAIPATGHTPAEAVRENEVAPTCSTAGSYDEVVYCSVCHEEVSRKQKTIPIDEDAHDWGEWVQTKAPTETEPGEETRTCKHDPSHTETRETPALGHDYAAVITEPTCTKGGYTTYTCTRCDDSYVADETAALGHDYVDGICSRCGAKDPNYKPIEPDKPCDGGASCPGKSFTDMPKPNNWAHAGIDFCVENGLFAGTSATTFSPDGNMTRAMLVTVLYRLEGQPAVTASNPFSDVANGQWFTNAIIWAADKGVVSGVGGGKFNPNGNITREQIATIMYRYAEYKSYDVSATADLKPFPDETDVSAWAYKALAWANAEGLISGVGANGTSYLQPLGNATRAQVAAILMRYVKNISKT